MPGYRRKKGKQWKRVTGADLDLENVKRYNKNKETRENNQAFLSACLKAGIDVTKRQSSRWNNNKGLAWQTHRRLV